MIDEINGGKDGTKRRKFIETMVNKDSFENMERYNHDRSESIADGVKEFVRMHKPYKNFKPTRMDITYMSMASTANSGLSNSHSIFLSTIIGQGSDEQVAFWAPKTTSFEICGSYAQT